MFKYLTISLILLITIACTHSEKVVIEKSVSITLSEVNFDSLSTSFESALQKIKEKEEVFEVDFSNNTDSAVYIFVFDSIFFTVESTSFFNCFSKEGDIGIHSNYDVVMLKIEPYQSKKLLFRIRLSENYDGLVLSYHYYKDNQALNQESADVVYRIKNGKLNKKVKKGESICK